jgi:hypothetical protein
MAIVQDRLKALHGDLESGVRTAGTTPSGTQQKTGWPKDSTAGPPKRSKRTRTSSPRS